MYIPYGAQWINEEDIREAVETLRSDFLTTGPKVGEFEETLKRYTNAKYAAAVSNGTAALHTACLAAGLKEGDEVVTSAITFAASANCALYCGATPVFADIEKDSYNISPDSIREKITSRTKAIIPVHFAGQPCRMDEIHKIAKERNLLVIEDAAHALGADYRGRKIGALSDMTCFSFHPVKHITTCEGGMVLTNNKELYDRLKLFRTHGITREEELLEDHEGGWYYEQQVLGYNYRISDVQCALGISQMKRLDYFVERRKAIARRYDEAFSGIEGIVTPQVRDECGSSWHLYVIQVEKEKRKAIFDALRASGIGVNVHYLPVYRHPYYRKHGYEHEFLPEAEAYYERCISLPMYPKLSEEEQDFVISKVIEIVNKIWQNC